MVIFGANGDLTKRKLMPALYRLAYDRRLSSGFAVVGTSRTPLTDDQFREKMREAIQQFSEDTKFDADVWQPFAQGLFYLAGDIGDAGLYQRLGQKLKEIEETRRTGGNVPSVEEIHADVLARMSVLYEREMLGRMMPVQ